MKIITAKSAGFCFGVKRAVDTVYELLEKKGKLYTYGPIIHNEEVVNDMKQKGVTVIDDITQNRLPSDGTIVIRSHGVSKEEARILEESGLEVVDATCPFVKKIHRIVEKASAEGDHVVVIGSRNHPEVQGIIGWCLPENPAIVIENEKEANDFTAQAEKKITIVSQTTFQQAKFKDLVEIFNKKGYYINVVNTICNATSERQEEAKRIAGQVDAMIVIGDRKSSNTQKLYEICSRECKNTQYVQTRDDLVIGPKGTLQSVGITAGASAPNKIIEEVQNYVRINF